MINELLGMQFNVEKARIDGKVQNLASYINEKRKLQARAYKKSVYPKRRK